MYAIRSYYEKAENPLKDYQLGKNEIFTIKAADKKTDLYCRMILPHDFDPSQKYPVIIYVYGGPHAQLINNTWLNDAGLWPYYMAGKGYIAFTLDNRGSANRVVELRIMYAIRRYYEQGAISKQHVQQTKTAKGLSVF